MRKERTRNPLSLVLLISLAFVVTALICAAGLSVAIRHMSLPTGKNTSQDSIVQPSPTDGNQIIDYQLWKNEKTRTLIM